MHVKIGTCGFSVGRKKYFKFFKIVEIQKTFYDFVKEETLNKWREEAPSDFEFSFKVIQLLTHPLNSPTYRRMKDVKKFKENSLKYGFLKNTKEIFEIWKIMEKVSNILRARFVVFQFPKSFKRDSTNEKNLIRFFNKVKGSFTPVVEFRDDSWKEIYEEIIREGIIIGGDPLRQYIPRQRINYFRLHGLTMYRYKYTEEDFKEIYRHLTGDENIVLFNNIYMFEDAILFKQFLNQRGIHIT